MISGFSFIYNAIFAGIPISESIMSVLPHVQELVIVDMQSNDGTREILDSFVACDFCEVKIIDGEWGHNAGETLRKAHSRHAECKYDNILHFEADEIFDQNLLKDYMNHYAECRNVLFWRLQLEQNFQRVRWYPELVHRFFQKGAIKEGHTTKQHLQKGFDSHYIVPMEDGMIWDITNCFRDNWLNRHEQQEELWHNKIQPFRAVPLHFIQEIYPIESFLKESHWTWAKSPFNLPSILKLLVGQTKYIARKYNEFD